MFRKEIISTRDLERYTKKNSYIPEEISGILSIKVFREIENVLDADVYVRTSGELWISSIHLHSLLRTSRANAKYIIQGIREKDRIEIEGVIFVRIAELSSIIFKFIEQESNFKRRLYLQFSEECLLKIRDESDVVLKRLEQIEHRDSNIKKLKKQRINKYNLIYDELTGELLDPIKSEFSHIRAKRSYPELAVEIDNGLVVNYHTHKVITSNSINDEEELLNLCINMNWNTDWYRIFKTKY